MVDTTRRRCLEAISSLYVPDPWHLKDFLAAFEARRGRAAKLMPPMASHPNGPYGVWVPTSTTDYIFTIDTPFGMHRDHIVLHEVGHMVFGHDGSHSSDQLTRLLLPGLSSELVRNVLGRAGYDTAEEREAEYFATALLEQARHRSLRTTEADSGDARTEPDRHSLADRQSFRRLLPLWRALTDAFPEVRFDTLGDWRDIGTRLYRQVIEICDAQLALRPYCDATVRAEVDDLAARSGLAGADRRAATQAALIAGGLAARAAGVPPSTGISDVIAVTSTPLDSEVAWLERVAVAYVRSPLGPVS
jgi:hypothetical protein